MISENHDYIIKVNNLTKKFDEFKAVDNISFAVKRGDIFAFLGPNGAGKSTTIKILTTLLNPNEGNVLVNGYNPLKEQDQVRRSFGIVFQDPSLDDDLTAYENMEFHGVFYGVSKKDRAEKIEYLLKFVELWDRKNDYVKNFSGGMKRRLEIARGLMHHPKIIFLDEPTLGLDPQTRNHIWTYIQELNKNEGITVFFTTHYMEEAEKVADKIAIIDHGKIIIQGTSSELKQKSGTNTLEEAFLSYTGKEIRSEEAGNIERMRQRRKIFHK